MKALGRKGAAGALALAAGLAAFGGRSAGSDVARFAELPVLHEGRVKPLESVARSTLLSIRGKQSIRHGKRELLPAEWLLDVLALPEKADEYKAFRVDDPELLAALGAGEPDGRYYAFTKLKPGFEKLERMVSEAESLESRDRTRVQAAALNLFQRLTIYQRMKNTLRPAQAENFTAEVEAPAGGASARATSQERLAGFSFMADAAMFRPLPPLSSSKPDEWTSMGQALLDAHSSALHPAAPLLARLADAWRAQDRAAFGEALRLHEEGVAPMPSARRSRWEAGFQRAQPFTLGMALYLISALLVVASWFTQRKGLERAGYAALAGAVAIHSAGLLARMWLEGRPPVTNLYSSAVFVGWVGGLVGLWQEKRSGGGLAAIAASVLGFCTLIIAHHLATQGDTMEMMRAVLDSNFWLATHVVSITVGYGAAFLAGTLAHVYLVRGVLTKSLDKESAKRLSSMTYFAICLSLLFSFLGTVLGGIWADQSWGRFWGWDPKENGALLIVLWLAIVLHCRWGGYVRERGVMAMAVFGNVVTALSWFGVNMLGIGLHSYGFMEGAVAWLGLFVFSQLAVMSLAIVPPDRWKSRQALA
ncbi:MAG: cytochrome c biogenesis protein CcsA [Elusimicrobia bacterium]|nr:cytochrome c biogenesis protein CcsA [Elusimicrobiota bacterium]